MNNLPSASPESKQQSIGDTSNFLQMNKQTIIIDGNNSSDLETFYDEIDKSFTKNLDWQTGHNLDAFNDLLRGGFGIYEYDEPIKLIWRNFSKSYDNLGKELIDKLIEIIKSHDHIEFITPDKDNNPFNATK